jgi:hypothetical protein
MTFYITRRTINGQRRYLAPSGKWITTKAHATATSDITKARESAKQAGGVVDTYTTRY